MNPVGEKHATGAATIIRITVIDNNYNSKQGRCLGTPTNFKKTVHDTELMPLYKDNTFIYFIERRNHESGW